MIKKFMIIILFAFFMISAVSASEIDEAVFSNHAEAKIQEYAEVNHIDVGEEITVDDIVEDDIVEDDIVIREDKSAPINSNPEYNDSYIINNPESYNEIENNKYNDTYNDVLIYENLENDVNLNNPIVSVYIFSNFPDNYEVTICMKIDISFRHIDFTRNLSKFKDEIDKFKVLTHEDLIFYNHYYQVLTHDVEESTILSNKLHTKFAFFIDNSIVDSEDALIYNFLKSTFSNFNLFSLSSFQTFSNFAITFINTHYYEFLFSCKTI